MVLLVLACAIILANFRCSGLRWKELDDFEVTFNNYSVTAEDVIVTMEEIIDKTTAGTIQFLYDIDSSSYLKPENNLKHDCWRVYQELSSLLHSMKIELVKLETPLVKRRLEIKERLADVNSAIEIHKKLVNTKYHSCFLGKGCCCNEETNTWLQKKVTSLRCRVMAECGKKTADHAVEKRSICGKEEFECGNGQCIPSSNVCDGDQNCDDGRDEPEGCEKYCFSGFHCDNLKCIEKSSVCNNNDDCGDFSDEMDCPLADSPVAPYSAANCTLESGQYLCLNRRCIALAEVCDGMDDCEDGTDEGGLCGTEAQCPPGCTAGGGVCFSGPQAPLCLSRCPPGLVEVEGHCLPAPAPPADTLEQLLEGVPGLIDRYSSAAGYLKRKVVAGLHRALENCQWPPNIDGLIPLRPRMSKIGKDTQ